MMTMFLLLKQLLAEQFKSENKPNMADNLKTRNEAMQATESRYQIE